MPPIGTLVHYIFAIGVVAMVGVVFVLAIQVFTLGTQANQNETKDRVKNATAPDTSSHDAYYAGFFHPYPNAGGGGERVLWTMVKAIQDKYPFIVCVIYSGDNVTRDELLHNVRSKFGLAIKPETVYVVELSRRWWIDHKFRRLTLLMQSFGSVWLAAQAIHRFCPDIFIDTVGFAFTYPLIRLITARIPIVSYTHYPSISSDMQNAVSSREAGFNNDSAIAGSASLTALKSVYYGVFGRLYAFAGSFASTIMTNSSWTHSHIVKLFGKPKMTRVVYPPCDTSALVDFAIAPRQPVIVSLAQFRPEKNHVLQVQAFAKLLNSHPEFVAPAGEKLPSADELLRFADDAPSQSSASSDLLAYPMLIMLGGARNIDDEVRAEELRQTAEKLGIERQVRVIVNAPWSQVLKWLRLGKVGIHTMRDEHFGINIVEMMAAGLLTIAHDSAGPKLDIITPAIKCGSDGSPRPPSVKEASAFLDALKTVDTEKASDATTLDFFPVGMVATTADEFAQMLALALSADGTVAESIARAARKVASTKFSEHAFCTAFYRRFGPVVRWLDIQRSDDDDDSADGNTGSERVTSSSRNTVS
ncbi:asparagine-linked glycosylation protein [Coemansia sp. RSA 1813]|nr:asparagine-linked glycosylation protein [Coemansia sp. RSA 1843]KAJ2090310.1 asparagine-linked glycosylation protein [Coemansia sp. RSA 986]KAJ2215500.1 asparagine-linked glycosylation protein [Coemansia sp. RSA 487]KAJ2566096.1 asparagine-linked glycosylation protein [Coemansia sp. RSA 1813]